MQYTTSINIITQLTKICIKQLTSFTLRLSRSPNLIQQPSRLGVIHSSSESGGSVPSKFEDFVLLRGGTDFGREGSGGGGGARGTGGDDKGLGGRCGREEEGDGELHG